MSIPSYGTRVHGYKYQFYQCGFNASNSCWLTGKWLTVPMEQYESERDDYERAHAKILAEINTQHHKNQSTPLKSMTPEQKKAWRNK